MLAKIIIKNYKWKKAPKLLLPDFDKVGYGYYVPKSRHPICFSCDHKETVEVGFCVIEKMFINETLLFTIDLLSFFDDLSDEWSSSYSTIPEEMWDQETLPNILLISKLVIYPEFRRRHFGLLAIKAIVESCSEPGDIVTVLSHPIKDNGNWYSSDDIEIPTPEDIMGLENFYKKAGFSDRENECQWATYNDVFRTLIKIRSKKPE